MTEPVYLSIAREFSRTPGSRYSGEGDHSGEQFREGHLAPKLREAVRGGRMLVVDLDGTAGYGTSFLEEAFGGLMRHDGFDSATLRAHLTLKSAEEPYLADDVWEYIDQQAARGGR